MRGLAHDIRLAARSLRRNRAFTAAAALTLALGIGATTAMFSIVDGVLVKPLPYPESERLVQLSEVVPGGTAAVPGPIISNLTIHAWEPQRRTIGPIANFGAGIVTVEFDVPRRLTRGGVAAHFFDVLALRPLAGRFFHSDDVLPGAAPVTVLSEELAREAFGGPVEAVGRTLVIDERPHQIVGVAPAGVALPNGETRLWSPTRVTPIVGQNGEDPRVELTRAIARLAPGATPEQASVEGTALARTVSRPVAAEMLFGKGGPVDVHVRTLAAQMTLLVRPALLVAMAGVGMLLLIACVNVANLVLSRGVARARELAVRVALGAPQGRLIRETLAETVLTSAVGGALGVALAWGAMKALPVLAPANFPRLDDVTLNWRSLIFAAAVSLASAMLIGLLPAFRAARRQLVTTLRDAAGASRGPRSLAAHRTLLVVEASLAALLLIAATLMGRSFVNLLHTETGYEASNVLIARVYLPGASRGEADSRSFLAELLPRVRALPGVSAAGASNMAPFGRSTYVSAFEIPMPGREAVVARALAYVVTPGYAESLKLRLRKGRFLAAIDEAAARRAVVVNEEFVRTFLGTAEPVGLQFEGQFGPSEIVGVVANVLKDSLDQRPQAEIYGMTSANATIRRELYLTLRTAVQPLDVIAPLRALVTNVRADAVVDGVEPLSAQLATSVAQPRFAAIVVLSLGGLALLLAAIGLYGVLAYTVALRRREIGVRTALGATSGRLVWMIVREGMLVAMLGIAAGAVGAVALRQLIGSALVGITALDPLSFGGAAAALLLVALLASLIPAKRAAETDAVIALRAE
jgi:predicted permease